MAEKKGNSGDWHDLGVAFSSCSDGSVFFSVIACLTSHREKNLELPAK